MANQIKISSNLLDIGNQQNLLEFLNFVNINTEIVKGIFKFMDPKHHEDFLKFKDCFQILQNLFPNFKIKFKQVSSNKLNNTFSQKQGLKTDDESQIISSISSQMSDPKPQQIKQLNQFQDQPNEIKPNGGLELSKKKNERKNLVYKLNNSLDASQEEDENSGNNIRNSIRNNQEEEVESLPSLDTQFSQSENSSINFSDFLELELKNIDNQDSKLSISLSSILNQSISVLERTQPNIIQIQGLTQKYQIQVQNDFILPMIQALFLPEWNTLTESLNLSKINALSYKQKLKQEFYFLKTQILAFIDSVQFIEVKFCYHSQYAMAAESKMNEFLKSIDVLTFQNHDGFFLASRKKTKENLQDIASQILNAYRGGLLYFSNIKPYQTQMDLNRDLAKARHLFFKKYLSQDLKQYSFYQYFNDQYFLYEMNFSKIQENRENAEKSIKKYIEAYCKNLFLIKFSISNNNEINHKFEMILQEILDENNHLQLVVSQSQNEFIIFGYSQQIQEYVNILLKTQKKIELRFTQMKFEIDTNNFMYQIKEDKNKIDLEGNLEIMKKYGFDIKESQGRIYANLIQHSKFNFENLFSIIRYFCQIKTSNQNYQDLLQLFQQFKKSIENKQLNEPINFLNKFQNNILEEKNVFNLGINININPQLQAFQYRDIIELKPSFLDYFIKENHLDEFETKFNQKNISFKKIDDGKYQLCSTSKQTLSSFTEYFSLFQTETIQLDDDSLRALDLSYMQKDQMKQQKIYYRVQNNELHVVSKKNQSSLQKFQKQITSYQGFLFYLLSLEKTNFNERTEYLNLVRARTGYMKIFIKGQQIQDENFVQQIEFREIQEISSFCIIHLIFFRSLNQNQKQECVRQIVDQYQQIFKLLYFLEIKTKPEIAEKIYSKIDKQQIYTTFTQQYNENFISILASKTNYQEIQRQFQQLQFSEEQWKDTEFCIYVEQFCPFKNLVQSQDCQQKLKRELEKKGFEVDDTSSIKWIIRPKILSQAVQIVQILASKMQDDNNVQILSNIAYQNQKSQSFESLLDGNSFFLHQLNQNMLYNPIKPEQKKDSPLISVQPKIEPIAKPKQQNQEEVKEHAKTLLPDSDILIKEKKSNENSYLSLESESVLSQSISEIQPNSQAEMFQFKSTFEKQCLLVEFQEKLNQIEPPQNEILVQFLKKNFSQIEFQYYTPEVDIDYQNYFSQMATTYTMLYIVQRPDKQYHNEFSKKIIYYLQLDKAIEKFMSHKSLILICFKANKLAHFWVPAKEKQYQICLKDSNQTLPYLWVKRK